jgi:HK97 family phage major capsid protein
MDGEEMLVCPGGMIKSLGNGKFGGYLVRFTTPKDPDLDNDFFSKETDLGVIDGGSLPLYYQHGMDGQIKSKRIGRGIVKYDDAGLWYEMQLELREDYEKYISQLAEEGKLGLSSGAAGHLVERESVGKTYHIKTWVIAEASLTPTPAEFRNMVTPVKNFIVTNPASDGGTTNQGEKNMDPKDENANPAAENELDAKIEAAVTKALDGKISPAIEKAIENVVKSLGPINGGGIAVGNIKKITDLGFKDDDVKTFLHWAKTGDEVAAKAALQGQTDSEGGYLVPDAMYQGVVEKRDPQSWVRRAGVQIVQTSGDVYKFPVEDTALTKFVVTAEEAAVDENEMTFNEAKAEVHNLTKLIKVSKQVLADNAANLEAYLIRAFGRADAKAENYYFTIGSGVGEPQGVLTGATSSAITTAGATAITAAEMVQLRGKLSEGYQDEDAGWLMQFATMNYIQGLTGNPFQFIPTPQGTNDGTLLTKKAFTSPDMEALAATKKAVLYGNFYFYGIVERQQMLIQRLVELYAANQQVGFLATVRKGGVVLQAEAFQYMTQHA